MRVEREDIIGEIRRIASERNSNQLSLSEFRSSSTISDWHVWNLFDSWNQAVEEAGLVRHAEREKISNDDLFIEMQRVFLSYGGICNRTTFGRLSRYSADVYTKKRFGHWRNVLSAFRYWLEQQGREFPFLAQLPRDEYAPYTPKNSETRRGEPGQKTASWDAIGGTTYGSFLNFRGLQHAPLNEQGVVFLFGMICFEIGFIVEAIRSEYPDCEAKRRVDRNRDKWERVRIEFEYRSSTFRAHGHDPRECDLIVCWTHDWQDCPLEVLELRAVVKTMSE